MLRYLLQTLSNEDGIFQVCWGWVVVVHLVRYKNYEPKKNKMSDYLM